MKIEIHAPLFIHEIGQRSNQEDYFWKRDATAADRLFIVCDGMGGHEHGEVASTTICESLGKWFEQNINQNEALRDQQLLDALQYAHSNLNALDNSDSPKKMGTTLTLVYFHSGGVTAAHIGDSRIYHVRPGVGVLYQSFDHSLVYELFKMGSIEFEEINTHPKKNIITNAITPGPDTLQPDIIHITDIQPGDYFYLCSDGMLEHMGNEELYSLLASSMPDTEKRDELIRRTVLNADNHTAWLIHVKGVMKEENDIFSENEEESNPCNAINIIRKRAQEKQYNDEPTVEIIENATVIPPNSVGTPRRRKWLAGKQRPIIHSKQSATSQSPQISNYKKIAIAVFSIVVILLVCAGLLFFLGFRGCSKQKNALIEQPEEGKSADVQSLEETITDPLITPKNSRPTPMRGAGNTLGGRRSAGTSVEQVNVPVTTGSPDHEKAEKSGKDGGKSVSNSNTDAQKPKSTKDTSPTKKKPSVPEQNTDDKPSKEDTPANENESQLNQKA